MNKIYIDAIILISKIIEIRDNANNNKEESINDILKHIDNMDYIKVEEVRR